MNTTTGRPIVTSRDYKVNPFIVIWEVTRACALKCLHCRAEAQYRADPNQLSHEEGKQLIDQIAQMQHPLLVFTGGDPLMRPDLYKLIQYAVNKHGLSVSMTPSATPRVTRSAVEQAAAAGLSRWAFSLDGSCDKIHDHFRGTPGSFERTMNGIGYLQDMHMPIQINTTVSRYNLDDLPRIAELVEEMGTVLWSLFFLIPTGRANADDMITPEQHEQVMNWLGTLRQNVPYGIKATEAPHYRRVLVQYAVKVKESGGHLHVPGKENVASQPNPNHFDLPLSSPASISTHTQLTMDIAAPASSTIPDNLPFEVPMPRHVDVLGRAPQGVNDGDGFVFISHIGDVYPSGFLPLQCGNVRQTPLADIYRQSTVMQELRDKRLLKGKCGVCEFKTLCGGSRARAYAITGDYLQSDPACAYVPAGWTGEDAQ
ncbi:radical SAM protein [Paenibacillus sp. WLX2291]|uniref:radical SAM protein n=1 Tax=Paenibacillus sp. WLX2291 TaxID=3296934 RepID=UPI0039842FEC